LFTSPPCLFDLDLTYHKRHYDTSIKGAGGPEKHPLPVALSRAGINGLLAAIQDAGAHAGRRFLEFFTANIRNRNTRFAYAQAVRRFFSWSEEKGIQLERILTVHVAVYIEQLGEQLSRPTEKQLLAAFRMLFDYLVTGGVLPMNPASSDRGPKQVVRRGKTPVLKVDEARALFDSIPTDTIVGLRDRAIIGVMCYSFARVSATVGMRIEKIAI
jgi:integrase/recombinase XerD